MKQSCLINTKMREIFKQKDLEKKKKKKVSLSFVFYLKENYDKV